MMMALQNINYDVAVILINYNSSEFTVECISSIISETHADLSYGVVIIDNASETEDYANLVDKLSQFDGQLPLQLFRSRINTGFSTGNMLGLQFVSAKYYFFLNNDCRLQNDCLNILFNFCEKNTEVALCSPQLHKEDGSHQPCFDYFPYLVTKILGLGILKLSYGNRFIKRKGIYKNPVRVDIVSGSQMFVRADIFNEIGGFDTTFFLYCEEEDIALRVHRKGYSTYLVPAAKNIHKGGGSTVPSMDIRKEFYISFLYFYRKNFGFIKQQALKLILCLRLLRKGITSLDSLKLCIFVASGAHLKYSMKHKQQIQKTYKIQS
jgi:GT2 family glycosyltransferase